MKFRVLLSAALALLFASIEQRLTIDPTVQVCLAEAVPKQVTTSQPLNRHGTAGMVKRDKQKTGELNMAEPSANVPKEKQTVLGLYVTAKEAYEKWKAEPEKVMILDVRTPEEYLFVGHPAMAWKIPVAAQTYEWDAEKGQFPMKPLPDFVDRVKEVANLDDTLMVMCRSGGRSALAVNLLAKAGFKHVHNIIDGMEGDVVKDPDSVFVGQRLKNGWKNSGCPWTYKLTPGRMVLPKVR
jgi:rhodanese-related sulfurtransferase